MSTRTCSNLRTQNLSHLCVVLVALVLVAPTITFAQSTNSKSKTGLPAVKSYSIDVANLPKQNWPAIPNTAIPASLPKTTTFPDDLTRVFYGAEEEKKWKADKTNKQMFNLSLATSGWGHVVSITRGSSVSPYRASYSMTFPTHCGGQRSDYSNRVVPLRWESVTQESNGDLVIQVSDGFFDPLTCEVKQTQKTRLTAKAIGTVGDGPICWLARFGDDDLTVMMPWTNMLSTDATAGAVVTESASLLRVRLPIRKGGAAGVAATFPGGYYDTWAANAAKQLKLSTTQIKKITLNLDAHQTSSDSAPLVQLRISGAD